MSTNTRALVAQLRDAVTKLQDTIHANNVLTDGIAVRASIAAIEAADQWLASPPANQCGETCAHGIDALAAVVTDADRLDFIEQQARNSRTGVSFDWVPHCEGEPRGYRMIWWHTINDQRKTMRDAIDVAMRSEGTT